MTATDMDVAPETTLTDTTAEGVVVPVEGGTDLHHPAAEGKESGVRFNTLLISVKQIFQGVFILFSQSFIACGHLLEIDHERDYR
jgi:hypothetical protein